MRARHFPAQIFSRSLWLGLALLLTAAALPAWAAAESDSDLKLVIILTRHGVRSPLLTNEKLGKFAAEPWPTWSVPPGILTPHGKEGMILMGAYYRMSYVAQGLLTGKTTEDFPRIFFRADNDQRTIETASDLATALMPGAEPDPHALPANQVDPLFQAAKANVGPPDRNRGIAAVLGRIGGNPASITQAYYATFVALQRVLCGGDGTPPAGKISVLDLPTQVKPGTGDRTVDFLSPLYTAEQIVDALLLEYAEGLPMPDVGWGRMTPATLTQLLQLHSLYFNLTQATFYPAQVQASNLASHLLSTLNQAVTGQAVTGAFGRPGQKLIIAVGHDTNIANLGGLLGLTWWLPGTQVNPVLPGGAMIFELRQRHRDGQLVVRTFYVSPTLEQTRTLQPLTLENPPAVAPIFIPGCSEPGPGFEAPLDKFEALLQRVIDPKFVVPGSP